MIHIMYISYILGLLFSLYKLFKSPVYNLSEWWRIGLILTFWPILWIAIAFNAVFYKDWD